MTERRDDRVAARAASPTAPETSPPTERSVVSRLSAWGSAAGRLLRVGRSMLTVAGTALLAVGAPPVSEYGANVVLRPPGLTTVSHDMKDASRATGWLDIQGMLKAEDIPLPARDHRAGEYNAAVHGEHLVG